MSEFENFFRRRSVIICQCKRFDNVPMKRHIFSHCGEQEEIREECERDRDDFLRDRDDCFRDRDDFFRNRCRRRHRCCFCNIFRRCRDRDDFFDRDVRFDRNFIIFNNRNDCCRDRD